MSGLIPRDGALRGRSSLPIRGSREGRRRPATMLLSRVLCMTISTARPCAVNSILCESWPVLVA